MRRQATEREKMWLINMKGCPTSLVVREKLIQIIMRHRHKPTRIAKVKQRDTRG